MLVIRLDLGFGLWLSVDEVDNNCEGSKVRVMDRVWVNCRLKVLL